jgi:hypothetical protein
MFLDLECLDGYRNNMPTIRERCNLFNDSFVEDLHHFPLVREVPLPNPTLFGSPYLSLFLGSDHTTHYIFSLFT